MKTDPAERSRALIGTPFRPQGRDPQTGLDCIGLVLSVHQLPLDHVRDDYRLRGDYRSELEGRLERCFRPVAPGNARPGDILLLQVTDDQLHLAVLTDSGFVHADARLRRVVETPGQPPWKVLRVYRRRVRRSRKGQ